MAFEIGDAVIVIENTYYTYTRGGQTGTIRTIRKDGEYCIAWDNDYWPNKKYAESWPIKEKHIELFETNAIPRTKLERKCRNLWNSSKYVQNNPTMAY